MGRIVQVVKVRQHWLPVWHSRERGQNMVEYSLLMSVGSLATFGLLLLTGPALQHTFGHIVDMLASI
jgi:Flp pilus assembly pilin Flp